MEQFVRRNLGAEVFERLVEPFCSGVYAGNPADLSIEAAFGQVQPPRPSLDPALLLPESCPPGAIMTSLSAPSLAPLSVSP